MKPTYKELMQKIEKLEREVVFQKKAAEALRESEKKFKTIFKNANDEIVYIDTNGNIIDVNDKIEDILGYTRKEVIGKHFSEFDFMAPKDLLKGAKFLGKVIQGFPPQMLEFVAIRKDGKKVNIEVNSRVIKKHGKVEGIVNIIRDITYRKKVEKELARYRNQLEEIVSERTIELRNTNKKLREEIEERKRTEKQLIQMQKMDAIGTLAGGIAHDFNNLLGGILGNVNILQDVAKSQKFVAKKLNTIEKIVNSGSELASQLLGFARGGKYQVKQTSLNHLIKDTMEIFIRTRKQIQVHSDFVTVLWQIESDQTQIEQVLLNLFINAADAMPAGGTISVKTENVVLQNHFTKLYNTTPGKYVKLNVSDTGHGMDKNIKDRIFEPFFTTKEQGKGTGLGLASAYGIIRNHNGIIEVASEPGQGTSFQIYLPAIEKKIALKKVQKNRIIRGDETVLLVDDEEDFRFIGKEMLKKMGYQVLTAKDGVEAVEIYSDNKNNIGLVVLDMIMPIMGGGETFDKLKEMDSSVKILLVSGYSQSGDVSEILSRGCNGFLQKPFSMTVFSEKLREVLDYTAA